MSLLDMRTVFSGYVLSNAVCAVVLAVLWAQNRVRFAGLSFWLADFVLQFAGVLLVGLRGGIPDFLSVVAGNAFIVGGTMLLYLGLERFLARPGPQIQNLLLLAAFIAAHSYFTYVQPNLAARTVTLSLGLLVICFECAWLLLRRVDAELRPVAWGTGLVFGGLCLLSVVRIALVWVLPPGNNFFQSNISESGAVLLYQILYMGLTFALCLMVNDRLNLSLEQRIAKRTGQLETANRALHAEVVARRQMEAQLRESEAKYHELFSEMMSGSALHEVICDEAGQPADYITLEVNQAYETLLGASREAVVGQKASAILPPDELKKWVGIFGPVALTGQPTRYEMYSPLNQKYFEGNVYCPVKGKFAVTFADVTARRQAEAGLRESEERYRRLFQDAVLGIFQSTPEGRVLNVNPAFARMFGYASPDEVKALVKDIGAEAYSDPARRAQILEVQQVHPEVTEFESQYRRKDGSEFTGSLHIWQVKDGAGRLLYLEGFVEDISARKQAEEKIRTLNAELEQRVTARTAELSARTQELTLANAALVRAGQLKDDFLANMSHELRTPLTAVLGLAEALQMGVYGALTEKQIKMLGVIRESGDHLLNLITDILDLSKLEAGKVELQLGPVEVQDVCWASLRFIRPTARKKNLRVSETFDPEVVSMQADARRLKQMLINLLSNAVKFTPQDGELGLTVEGDAAQREVRFVVWDTGIGIAPENLPRLFKPFTQLDSRLAREYEGTGLGLSLVHHMAELHGGFVTAESDGVPGKGSRFTLTLPWRPAARPDSEIES